MAIQPNQKNLSEVLLNYERRLRSLETSKRAGNTSIDSGALEVRDDTNATVMRYGQLISGGYGLEQNVNGNWIPAGNPGIPTFLAGDTSVPSGATLPNDGNGYTSNTVSVPSHTPGTLRVRFNGQWVASVGPAVAASNWRLWYAGNYISGTFSRQHNNGDPNNPSQSINCDGFVSSDGSGGTLELVGNNDVGSASSVVVFVGAFAVWRMW